MGQSTKSRNWVFVTPHCLAIWAFLTRQLSECVPQFGEVDTDDRPYQSQVDAEVVVYDPIAETNHLRPRHATGGRPVFVGKSVRGLPYDLQIADDCVRRLLIFDETALGHAGHVAFDLVDDFGMSATKRSGERLDIDEIVLDCISIPWLDGANRHEVYRDP